MDNSVHQVSTDFPSELGLLVESEGWLPRMAGRILGMLLSTGRPMSQAQLGSALEASAGTVSTMTRMLIANNLVQRVSVQGERTVYYQARADVWKAMEENSLRSVMRYTEIARAGLESDPDNTRIAGMLNYFKMVEERCQIVLNQLEADLGASAAK